MNTPEKVYTRDEVALHNKSTNLWVIYNRKVYDLTSFYPLHPGGEAILKKAGQDVTEILHTYPVHASVFKSIERRLNMSCIGSIKY